MLRVVETIEDIIQTLYATGQLDNTYIFFSSDNGFYLGQHRLPAGKNTKFEEDLHVPLVVRGLGIPAGQVLEHLLLNIDLAPTFAELAGVPVPTFVDGRSLVSLLRGDPPPVENWRQAFLLEHGFIQTGDSGRTPADASGAVEPPDQFDLVAPILLPPFQGLHTRHLVYIEYLPTGERELYNLDEDPYEQTSIADTAEPVFVEQLAAWLERLRTCAEVECRAAEDLPPCDQSNTCSAPVCPNAGRK